jgi:hypothetical protein
MCVYVAGAPAAFDFDPACAFSPESRESRKIKSNHRIEGSGQECRLHRAVLQAG